jgi:hypothetical protein
VKTTAAVAAATTTTTAPADSAARRRRRLRATAKRTRSTDGAGGARFVRRLACALNSATATVVSSSVNGHLQVQQLPPAAAPSPSKRSSSPCRPSSPATERSPPPTDPPGTAAPQPHADDAATCAAAATARHETRWCRRLNSPAPRAAARRTPPGGPAAATNGSLRSQQPAGRTPQVHPPLATRDAVEPATPGRRHQRDPSPQPAGTPSAAAQAHVTPRTPRTPPRPAASPLTHAHMTRRRPPKVAYRMHSFKTMMDRSGFCGPTTALAGGLITISLTSWPPYCTPSASPPDAPIETLSHCNFETVDAPARTPDNAGCPGPGWNMN